MSFYVENDSKGFERCPPGMHLARCYRVIDLGTQKTVYKGEPKYQRKLMLSWEIHGMDENGKPMLMADGRPFSVFKNYTFSWSEKANLRLDLQSWRGRPFTAEEVRRFDLKNILGAWCMLNVIEREGQNGNTYSNVDGVTPVPSMIKQNGYPAPVNKNEIFNLSEPDMELYKTFSENLKTKIGNSPEWQKLNNMPQDSAPQADDRDETDDIPF